MALDRSSAKVASTFSPMPQCTRYCYAATYAQQKSSRDVGGGAVHGIGMGVLRRPHMVVFAYDPDRIVGGKVVRARVVCRYSFRQNGANENNEKCFCTTSTKPGLAVIMHVERHGISPDNTSTPLSKIESATLLTASHFPLP